MPVPGRNPDDYLDWRVAAADRLRRLGQALVAHRPSPEVLDRLVVAIDSLLPEVTASSERSEPFDFVSDPELAGTAGSGGEGSDSGIILFPDSVVSGPANPMGMGAVYRLEGNQVVARVVLGPAFEGAPGRAHGGVVAAIIDETMGAVLPQVGTPAYTGTLTIRYLAPVPIGEELVFRAWLHHRDRRKLTIHASGQHRDTRFAEAEGVFITVPEYKKPPAPGSADGP